MLPLLVFMFALILLFLIFLGVLEDQVGRLLSFFNFRRLDIVESLMFRFFLNFIDVEFLKDIFILRFIGVLKNLYFFTLLQWF